MRVVLHAGLSKTGSTSIQKTFDLSRAALAQSGVIFPKLSDALPHHGMLLPAIFGPDEWRREYGAPTEAGKTKMRALSIEAWARLDAAAAEARARGATLVVSSEHFASLRRDSLERIAARIGGYGGSLETVVYFRRPADHYLSKLQQGFKASGALKDPLAHRVRFRRIAEKLEAVFGAPPAIRAFDRDRFPGGDVVRDFARNVLGLDAAAVAALTPVRDNDSLSAEGMAVMAAFRAVNFPDSDGVFNRQSKTLMRAIQTEERLRPYTRPRLDPEIAAAIDRNHAAELLWLRDMRGVRLPGVDYAALESGTARDVAPIGRLGDLIALDPALERQLAFRVLNKLALKVS